MINKRLFGTPISGSVRQKLEARQKVAGDLQFGQSKNGTQMIDGVFPDADGKVQAYLSSRTPFVRMWTSVKIIEAGEVVEDIDTVVVNTEDEDLLKEYKKGIQCHFCIDQFSDDDRKRFEERQKQIDRSKVENHKIHKD